MKQKPSINAINVPILFFIFRSVRRIIWVVFEKGWAVSDWDGLDDNEDQGAAAPAGVDGGDGDYEPLDGYVDLNQRQAPFQASGRQWTPAPLDGSVDLTPAPMQGLLGNFKALPFDGTSERWLYHLPNTRGQAAPNHDGVRPWIISRPIDLAGGTSDPYFRTLGDPTNGSSEAPGAASVDGQKSGANGQVQVGRAVPSPHAGLYSTLDDAAKAAMSDVPRNAPVEYGAAFPRHVETSTVDFGDGYGPQQISRVTGYDYNKLYTSDDPAKVNLPMTNNAGGWFHNHPSEPSNTQINIQNQNESPGDQNIRQQMQSTSTPLFESYVLGPDGVLRKFWINNKGQVVK